MSAAVERLASAAILTASLRPFATLPDWLLAFADPERVRSALAHTLPELASGHWRLIDCAIKRVRSQPEGWTALYHLTIEDARQERRAITWQGRLIPPGSSAPAAGRLYLPELRVELCPPPPEAELATLPILMDASAARELLERSLRSNAAYRTARLAACAPQVMRHTPGSRCAIRYRLEYLNSADANWPDFVIAKTYRGSKGRHAYASMAALWASPLAAGRVVRLAEPLAYLPELKVLLQGPVRGEETLQDLIRSVLRSGTAEAQATLRDRLRQTAVGLAALHATPVAVEATRVWEDELAEVRALLAELGGLIPALATAAEPLLHHLEGLAAQWPADPACASHGTFRPAQVLLHEDEIGFIDFDGFCQAEPALDVALFLAKVKDLGLSALAGAAEDETVSLADPQNWPAHLAKLERLCEDFLTAYTTVRPISRRRLALWEVLHLLTLVLHRWTKVKPARLPGNLFLLERQLRVSGLWAD